MRLERFSKAFREMEELEIGIHVKIIQTTKIGQKSEQSPENLKRITETQTPEIDQHLTLE